jgi:hypothetical protein
VFKRTFLTALAAFTLGVVMMAVMLAPNNALAGSRTVNNVTLTWPNSYDACAPVDSVTLSGIPLDKTVTINFTTFNSANVGTPRQTLTGLTPDGSGNIVVGVPYPPLAEWETMPDGSQRIIMAVAASVNNPDGTSWAKLSGQWSVTCRPAPPPSNTPTNTPEPPTSTPTNTPEPPTATPTNTPEPPTATPTNTPVPPTATPTNTPVPQGGQGCTPGYWRQDHHYDSWVGYAPGDNFDTVFGVSSTFSPKNLGNAVQLGGGGERALARHAVAALLNAASPGVSYLYSEAEVKTMVQSAYATGNFEGTKNLLEAQNEKGCPLN